MRWEIWPREMIFLVRTEHILEDRPAVEGILKRIESSIRIVRNGRSNFCREGHLQKRCRRF